MRLSSSRIAALTHRPQQDFPLWDKAGTRPSLDLQFADRKDLVDATTGSKLVDHTRASSGTYVGSDGLIKTATTNLLLQSEDFSTTWNQARSAVSANSQIAPNGTTTADIITGDGTADFPNGVNQSTSAFGASGAKTFSVYAKAGTNDFVQLFTGGNVNVYANFNLANGTKGTIGTQASAEMVFAGNGWYRCSISTTETNPASVAIILVNSGSAVRGEITGSSNSIYLWGAQLEQSDTVGEYVKTTSTINSAPRFDHDPTTGESLGLLVEESRTNLVQFSEDFGDPAWTKEVDVSATGNTINFPAAPDFTTSVGAPGGRIYEGLTVPVGSVCTATLIVPPAGDWSDSTATIKFGIFSYYADALVTSQSYWQFVRVTATDNGNGTFTIAMKSNKALVISGLKVQFEVGSFGTSYIPTEGSTVTRAADVASITGSNFSSWYRQEEGSIFSDSSIIASQVQTQVVYGFTGGSFVTTLRQPQSANNRFRAQINGTFSPPPGTGAVLTTGTTKAAIAYLNTTGRLQVGSAGDDVSAAGTSDANELVIGGPGGFSAPLNGRIKRLTYWPTRLGNDTLQTITQ